MSFVVNTLTPVTYLHLISQAGPLLLARRSHQSLPAGVICHKEI